MRTGPGGPKVSRLPLDRRIEARPGASDVVSLPLPRPRVGVVLAAGRSERLARVTGGGSKALVRVGGLALVGRAVRTLLRAGLRRVVVVVGYQAGPVAAVVDRLAPGRVRAVFAESELAVEALMPVVGRAAAP